MHHEDFNLPVNLSYFETAGYTPIHRSVTSFQSKKRRQIDENPARFMRYDLAEEIEVTRQALGNFLNCDATKLTLVLNATYALGSLLQNIHLEPDDEILVIEPCYPGIKNALDNYCKIHGCKLRALSIQGLFESKADWLSGLQKLLTNRVKLAVIEHVSSPSAVCLPVKEISQILADANITTIVDGAGAPGGTPVDIRDYSCDFYIGNCHKWLGAPRTTAFIYTSDFQDQGFRGLLKTHSDRDKYRYSLFQSESEKPGAYDPSAALSVKAAIDLIPEWGYTWDEVIARNHQLLFEGLEILNEFLDFRMLAPRHLCSSSASIILESSEQAPKVQEYLFKNDIAAICFNYLGNVAVRLAPHYTISEKDYRKLGKILKQIL